MLFLGNGQISSSASWMVSIAFPLIHQECAVTQALCGAATKGASGWFRVGFWRVGLGLSVFRVAEGWD